MTTTLKAELDRITAEDLGPDADEIDVRAYREALASAWSEIDVLDEEAEEICTAVLHGEAGRIDGLSWVQRADAMRDPRAAVWTLCIEGEGDHPDSATGLADESAAVEWAEGLIRQGDWDRGNRVTYYLSRDGERTDTTHQVTI